MNFEIFANELNMINDNLRPSTCIAIIKNYLCNKITKEKVLNKFCINSETFDTWLDFYKHPPVHQLIASNGLEDSDKLKLVSGYLLGELTADDLKTCFNVSFEEISAWAVNLAEEEKLYKRERVVSAEEKFHILHRYFKGEYSVSQFKNEFFAKANLLDTCQKELETKKQFSKPSLNKTASEELIQAYNIYLKELT